MLGPSAIVLDKPLYPNSGSHCLQLELFVTQSEIYAWTLHDCARQATLSEFWLALFAAGAIRYAVSNLHLDLVDLLKIPLQLEIQPLYPNSGSHCSQLDLFVTYLPAVSNLGLGLPL